MQRSHHEQSSELTNVADRILRLGKSDIEPYLSYVEKPAGTTSSATATAHALPSTENSTATNDSPALPSDEPQSDAINKGSNKKIDMGAVVKNFLNSQKPKLDSKAIGEAGRIEKEVDRALLLYVSTELGNLTLTEAQKRNARAVLHGLLKA